MKKREKVIVAGAGIAGLTCAIYLSRAGFNVDVYSNEGETMSCLEEAPIIENFPGFPDGISGADLLSNTMEQSVRNGASIHPQGIVSVDSENKTCIDTDNRCLGYDEFVMATGVTHRKFTCDGSESAVIHQCAICDGGLYGKNDTLAVIGGGDTAIGDAFYLSSLVKKVYVIIRRDVLRITNRKVYDSLINAGNVEVMKLTTVTRIVKNQVSNEGCQSYHLFLNNGDSEIDVDGIFACIGFTVNSIPVIGNRPIWECGDCRDGAIRQAIIAAGNGAEVAMSIINYLGGS